MQIVLKFAKHGRDNKEVIRQKVIKLNTTGFSWGEAEAAASFHVQKGERIVMIAEAGYH